MIWPQVTLLAITIFAAGTRIAEIANNIPPKPRSPWIGFAGFCIAHTLLYFGGFWAPLGFAP